MKKRFVDIYLLITNLLQKGRRSNENKIIRWYLSKLQNDNDKEYLKDLDFIDL